jgi:hypothetical protein
MAIKSMTRFYPAGPGLQNGEKLNRIFGYPSGEAPGTAVDQVPAMNIKTLTVAGSFTSSGNSSSAGYAAQSVAGALTAVGTNRATALVLAAQINDITTAAASTGAVLPLGTAVGLSAPITIFNAGANPITVYASGTDTIDGAAGATGVTLTNAKRCIYFPISTSSGVTTWISAQLGVVSA